ncbi:flocculation protein FLO11 isoform X2 [Hypomesus transpacificus]|nr:flocculation protein FLO11 isoform X2 [Hypomesus transpacificus]
MQRMIRQFAAEYTSKTSSSQDSPQPTTDQSLPRPPSAVPPAVSPGVTAAASAHDQNPVLSKLLMADQDSPLDLTIKKPPADTREQDGVLDLSLKKGQNWTSPHVRSPPLSQATPTLRGESAELLTAKAQDLQSTSTLEQFMAKLCPHHQKQIVDALGFLQTEVKAVKASSCTSQASNPALVDISSTSVCSESCLDSPARTCIEPTLPLMSTPKGQLEVQEMASVDTGSSVSPEKIPETTVSLQTSGTGGPALDLRKTVSEGITALAGPIKSPIQRDITRPSDHVPLKIKIMKSGSLGDGKKLSCVLTTSVLPPAGKLEERQVNTDPLKRAESHSARLSSQVKRRHHSDHSNQARQRGAIGHTKGTPSKPCTEKRTPDAISHMSPRTARKTIRGSSCYRARESSVFIADPDLGHCDLVYIDKPITESLRRQRHRMLPRRNARKSTRGHLYVEEMWELKTVRTLASKSRPNANLGNYPIAPMPDLISLVTVTPKQAMAKPDGVPLVDIPIAEGCRETASQKTPSEQLAEMDIPGIADGAGEAAASEANPEVENSESDQSQCKDFTTPPPLPSQTQLNETEQVAVTDSEQARESVVSEERVAQTVDEPAGQDASGVEVLNKCVAEVMETEVGANPTGSHTTEETLCVSDEVQNGDLEPQQEAELPNPVVDHAQDENQEEKEQAQAEEAKTPEPSDSSERKDQSGNETQTVQELKEVEAVDMAEPESAAADMTTIKEEHTIDPLIHFSPEKSLEALLKELPPWRRKRHEKLQPKPVIFSETEKIIVGYVNGRPIKASDRCLRRRSEKSSPKPVKSHSKGNHGVSESSSAPGSSVDSVKSPSLKRAAKAHTKFSVQPIETKPETPSVAVSPVESVQSPAPKHPTRSGINVRRNIMGSKSLAEATQSAPDPLPTQDPEKKPAPETETLPAPVSAPPSTPAPVPDCLPTPVLVSESPPAPPFTPVPEQTDSPKTQEFKRPLRSAKSKKAGAAVSPPQSIAMTSSVSEGPTTSLPPTSTEPMPLLPTNPSPLPISAPPLPLSSTSTSIEPSESQQTPAPQAISERSVDAVEAVPDSEKQSNMGGDCRVPARQKLRSSGIAKEFEEAETPKAASEVPSLPEGPGAMSSEATTQSSPLRGKQTPVKDREASKRLKAADATPLQEDRIPAADSRISLNAERPGRMPLRSESSKAEGATSHSMTPGTPIPSSPPENRKSALRSQKLASPSSSTAPITPEKPREVLSPFRVKPEKITKLPPKSSPMSSQLPSSLPSCSGLPFFPPRLEPPAPTPPKFLEALNSEEHQHMISNLNTKFDKMQKGWFQMDKEGQPAPKHKNKADRQAAIWKSKRRVRKPRSSEHQRFSPVQMLFMKNFDLSSICRWFLQSTETKSLVIVKKVNTRLPSETQLCFHSSSCLPGTSQGVFPSLQAERLKKHLKKFAIASPVKSTPKSQKLIAKALEQEVPISKGKEKKELTTATRISTKPYTASAEIQAQASDAQKASVKAKIPASARILRKYNYIREKMQVQQTSKKVKDTPRESLKAANVKTSNSKPKLATVKGAKPCRTYSKKIKEPVLAKSVRGRPSLDQKPAGKESVVKTTSSRTVREPMKRDSESSQKLPQKSPKTPKSSVLAAVAKTDSHKKQVEDEKPGADRSPLVKPGAGAKEKLTKKASQSKVTESRVTVGEGAERPLDTPLPDVDATTPPVSSDQVLTRSQRKMEVMPTQSASPKSATKKAQEPTSGTPKSATKRAEGSAHTQKGNPKCAAKRGQEAPQTPAKRTRMSLTK